MAPARRESSRRRSRYTRLRLSIGRHPADLVRIAVSAGIVIACLVVAGRPGVNPVEGAIFTQVERIPAVVTPAAHVLTWCGGWPGIAAAVALALYLGRVRLSISLTLGGVGSWFLVALLHWLTAARPMPLDLLPALRVPPSGAFDFPSPQVAVVTAMAVTAAPYLTRTVRNSAWVVVVLVAAADVFLGLNLPLGVFAGGMLGWGVGTVVHLVMGAPGRKTSEVALQMALRQAGIEGAYITEAHRRPFLRPQIYDVCTADGEQLEMKVVRRLHRLAGPSYKLRRLLASLEVQHEPILSTPRHEVDHEAYVTLLAERAGVGTIPVLLAGEIEHGPSFLLRRRVRGRLLSDYRPDEVSEPLLDEIWRDIAALGARHIAHHELRADNVLVDETGHPRITDFTFSRVGGPADQSAQDIAEMLVSLSSVVGVRRAVRSAHRSLPRESLVQALPHLQWLAMHRRLRNQLTEERLELSDLRERLAEQTGEPVPPFRPPVNPTMLVLLLAGGAAVYLLLPQLSSFDEVLASLRDANWWWLGLSVVTAFVGIVISAVTVLGSSPTRLPTWRTIAVQVAAAFTGRTTAAGIGFYGINVVFLEKLGLRRSRAVGVVLLNRAVVGIVGGVLTAVGLLVIGHAVPVGDVQIPTSWMVWLGVGLVVCAVVAFLATPYGRRRVWLPLLHHGRDLARDLLPTLRHPVRATQLFGGSVLFLIVSGLGLAATLAAFDPQMPLIAVIAVYIVAQTLGQLAPTPGGLGAVEAAMVAGLTAVGIDPTNAVTAVLAMRVLTFWFPAVPGIVAFRILQHHNIV